MAVEYTNENTFPLYYNYTSVNPRLAKNSLNF